MRHGHALLLLLLLRLLLFLLVLLVLLFSLGLQLLIPFATQARMHGHCSSWGAS